MRAAISLCSTAGSKGAATGTAGVWEDEREEVRECCEDERMEREDDMEEDGAPFLRPVEDVVDLGVCMMEGAEGRSGRDGVGGGGGGEEMEEGCYYRFMIWLFEGVDNGNWEGQELAVCIEVVELAGTYGLSIEEWGMDCPNRARGRGSRQ